MQGNQLTKYQSEQLEVLHQFGKLLSGVRSKKLLSFIESTLNVNLERPKVGLRNFEANNTVMRFQLFQCACWLLSDWPNNLYLAWQSGGIRYNLLLKDMISVPFWFASMVEPLKVHYKKRIELLKMVIKD